MQIKVFFSACLFIFCGFRFVAPAQIGQPYSASFIGRMGIDTVLVETYSMIHNHLYGKAFIRVPEDYIALFSIHFHSDSSIREFNVAAMDPFNSSIPFKANSGALEYRLNMNCINDTCTYYNSSKGLASEKVFKHPSSRVDFVGGWVPFISLMEWNCIRLAKSKKGSLPLRMINHNIGVYPIGVAYLQKDNLVFGGPFLEYTKIVVDSEGRIKSTDGIGTPWNYYVTKHAPIDIDAVARRMATTRGIGIPSSTEAIQFTVKNIDIKLSYGRPWKRGRIIFGGVVPYDSVWRTGANGVTTISLSHAIKMGKSIIPEGEYSLYTIPGRDAWTLIFSHDLKSWPTDPDRSKDFQQVTIPVVKADNIKEQFTIEIAETRKGGVLKFHWDDTMALAEFQILKE